MPPDSETAALIIGAAIRAATETLRKAGVDDPGRKIALAIAERFGELLDAMERGD